MNDFSIDQIAEWIKSFDPDLPTGNKFLDSRYQDHIDKFNHPWPYYRLFYQLAVSLMPRTVLEIGGYQGTAAAHFAGGFGGVGVITIDHHSDPGDEINEKKMIEVVAQFLNVTYIKGWSTDRFAIEQVGHHARGNSPSAYHKVIGLLQSEQRYIDILFIDSWHHYEYAMLDWEAYQPFLNSPALVICDDIVGDNSATISGMMRFWNELPGKKYLDVDNLHPGSGLGFLKYEII